MRAHPGTFSRTDARADRRGERRELEVDRHRLFIGKSNGRVPGFLTASLWKLRMKQFAVYVGADWELATHQLRRAFAMIIGEAAGPVKAFRAKHQLASVASRKKLIEDTADVVSIRATGHGWCLASDVGCGGQGLYEPTRCRECRNGLMDDTHVPV